MKVFYINPNDTISSALKKLKKSGARCLVVAKKKYFLGTLSDGDIRNKLPFIKQTDKIDKYYNKKAKYLFDKCYNNRNLENLLIIRGLDLVPILHKSLLIKEVILRSDFIKNPENYGHVNKYETPVIIMSGGFGKRLSPITNVIPKPLIPLGKWTVLEEIINNFRLNGCNNIIVSVNYLSELITTYLRQRGYKKINFLREKKKLGTIGSISLLNRKYENIIVTNCDTIINLSINKLLNTHNINENDATIVIANKFFTVPYGVCNIENKILKNIAEKPKYNFSINTGMYVLRESAVKLIFKNKKLDFDELFLKMKKKKLKIGTYIISNKNWRDTGDFNQLEKTLNEFKTN